VSTSKNGRDIPKIYFTSLSQSLRPGIPDAYTGVVLDDITVSLTSKNDIDISEVIQINGMDAAKYVADFSLLAAPL
jgi:hypothetical protein